MVTKKSNKKQPSLETVTSFTPEGKIAWIILLVLIAIVPLAMSNATAFGFSQPFSADVYDTFKITFLRIGVVFALAFWVLDVLKNGTKLRTTPLYYVLAAFLVVVLISTFTSVSPVISFFGKYRRYEGLWTYLIYTSIFFLSIQYAFTFNRVKQIARTLSYTSGVVALYGLVQTLGYEPLMGEAGFEAGRSYSTLGNPDFLAGFLAFGLFITLGLVLVERAQKQRIVYWVILLLNAIVTITAFARSIWVGAFFGFIALAVILFLNRPQFQKADYGFLGGIGVAVAAFIGVSLGRADGVTNFAARMTSIFNFHEGSAKTRFLIWESAIDAIKDRPLLGFGPDTFRLVFRRYQPVDYSYFAGYQSVADNVHNYILQLAAGIGVPGMLLFYGLGLVVAFLSFPLVIGRRSEKTNISKEEALLYAGFWLAALAYMVHLFFGISLSGTTFLLFISYGVLLAPLCKTVEIAPVKVAIKNIGVTIAFTGAILVSIASFAFLLADGAFMAAKIATSNSDLYRTMHELDRAHALNPFNDMYRTERFQVYSGHAILSAQNQIPNADGSEMTQEDLKKSIALADRIALETIAFNPWEFDNYPIVIAYYNQIGEATGDKSYFEKALKLAEGQIPKTPHGLALRYVHAQTLLLVGRTDEARKELEFCITNDPNFEAAKRILSQFE